MNNDSSNRISHRDTLDGTASVYQYSTSSSTATPQQGETREVCVEIPDSEQGECLTDRIERIMFGSTLL